MQSSSLFSYCKIKILKDEGFLMMFINYMLLGEGTIIDRFNSKFQKHLVFSRLANLTDLLFLKDIKIVLFWNY